MRRVPSIHITFDKLKEICIASYGRVKGIEISNLILNKAHAHSCSNRVLVVSNQMLQKKAEKLTLGDKSLAHLFARLLVFQRRKLKHRGISVIKESDSEWATIKKLANEAKIFCDENDLKYNEGFSKFITIGLEKIKNYSLNKFISLVPAITETYQAMLVVAEDSQPELTEKLHQVYYRTIEEKTGLGINYKNDPVKYACFIQARKDAQSINMDFNSYIKAQFENNFGVPYPIQLHGEKAIQKAIKYAHENNLSLRKKNTNKLDISKIKRAKYE